MSEQKSKLSHLLTDFSSLKWSTALKGILCGVTAGLLVVLYRLGIEFGTETAVKVFAYLRENPVLILPWMLLALGVGLVIAWLVKLEPMATGSGIPQVEGVLLYGLKIKWYTVLAVRFGGGILSSFFGLSLGREGPSIQIGAAGSQAVAKKISKNKLEENYLITGGAAAGLSAAFNAPLSGIVFALEEVHRSFSGLILLAATTAALTADVVSKLVFGLKPVLSFTATPQLPVHLYLWLIPLGLLSGAVGALMNRALLLFQTLYKRLPWFLRPMMALLLALPCGLFLPQVLGGGQNLIYQAETADGSISFLLVLLAVKLLFTCISFGSGTPGGIFLPILSVGALSGGIIGLAAVQFGLPAEYVADFAICTMAGALSGSVKAPVTSILLVAEMTGSLVHLLPVAACSFLALLVSDLLKTTPIYEALLERMMDKCNVKTSGKKRRSVLELPVELGCGICGKKISEVQWPQGMLVVSIRRGETEIVPNGDTLILQGDYLMVLSHEGEYREISKSLREISRAHTEQ
ncbi:ClC family H(+)/Cl(-) exchange transporter [Acetanaerobacterium elongatum]|uniref:H+/Cl-antiporter ClcA n=1 Tax=Acetanaerobacterium elongatum TaxID=258515 RepID=A0A1H0D0P2_9FIRM|nr:ClC family H(+)/Cl(-) exchange transporter [Acetanaerobacterium elongatum]SDN63747.1 H+/Cl-antiporter ClcA [Acetanaerobacterium elongatum]